MSLKYSPINISKVLVGQDMYIRDSGSFSGTKLIPEFRSEINLQKSQFLSFQMLLYKNVRKT